MGSFPLLPPDFRNMYRPTSAYLRSIVYALLSLAMSIEGSVILISGDGKGASAYTDSSEPHAAFGFVESTRLVIQRATAKAYLRFDLSNIEEGIAGRICQAKLILQQTGEVIHNDEALEIFAVNLNYPFGAERRLEADWTPYLLTHATAPASGAGGSVSTANSRSQFIGRMVQSADGVYYQYEELASMATTPLLDYLNGISGFSGGESPMRVLIVAEAPDQARNNKIFASVETGEGTLPPTLEIQGPEVNAYFGPAAFDEAGEMAIEYRVSPKGMALSFEQSPDLESWVEADPLMPLELLESGNNHEVWRAVFELSPSPDQDNTWQQFIRALY